MNAPQAETTRHLLDWHNRLGLLTFAVLLGIIIGLFGGVFPAQSQTAPDRRAGVVFISPSLAAFAEDIDDPISPYAPPRDEAGNFLIQFGVLDARTQVWGEGTATLEVLRDGVWVPLETVSFSGDVQTVDALFAPVAFTPDLGDMTYAQWWPDGRMEFRIVATTVYRRQTITVIYDAPVYRCLHWGWGGCIT
jgi:hypothetical protein